MRATFRVKSGVIYIYRKQDMPGTRIYEVNQTTRQMQPVRLRMIFGSRSGSLYKGKAPMQGSVLVSMQTGAEETSTPTPLK